MSSWPPRKVWYRRLRLSMAKPNKSTINVGLHFIQPNLRVLVAGKYLKELYDLHEAKGTLEITQDSIGTLCPKCKNADTCGKAGKATELTCLCLESVF